MSSFTFHKPQLVRRAGTLLVIGTSIVLLLLTLFLTNIVRAKYQDISEQQQLVMRSERLNTAQAGPTTASTFYSGDTPQLSQSQMQSDMQTLADQNKVILEVIRADQIEELGGALRLALTLNGVVRESELGAYIANLADHEPTIVVESISLRRARTNNRGVDDRPLAIQLKLSGFAAQ